jgi:hypothetical protein
MEALKQFAKLTRHCNHINVIKNCDFHCKILDKSIDLLFKSAYKKFINKLKITSVLQLLNHIYLEPMSVDDQGSHHDLYMHPLDVPL